MSKDYVNYRNSTGTIFEAIYCHSKMWHVKAVKACLQSKSLRHLTSMSILAPVLLGASGPVLAERCAAFFPSAPVISCDSPNLKADVLS